MVKKLKPLKPKSEETSVIVNVALYENGSIILDQDNVRDVILLDEEQQKQLIIILRKIARKKGEGWKKDDPRTW